VDFRRPQAHIRLFGPWAVAAPTPKIEIKRSLFASFSSEKEGLS
jgi:hypothetical protein